MPTWLTYSASLAMLAVVILILFGGPVAAFWLWGAAWGILATLALAVALYLLLGRGAKGVDDAYALLAGLVLIGLGGFAGLVLAIWRLVA